MDNINELEDKLQLCFSTRCLWTAMGIADSPATIPIENLQAICQARIKEFLPLAHENKGKDVKEHYAAIRAAAIILLREREAYDNYLQEKAKERQREAQKPAVVQRQLAPAIQSTPAAPPAPTPTPSPPVPQAPQQSKVSEGLWQQRAERRQKKIEELEVSLKREKAMNITLIEKGRSVAVEKDAMIDQLKATITEKDATIEQLKGEAKTLRDEIVQLRIHQPSEQKVVEHDVEGRNQQTTSLALAGEDGFEDVGERPVEEEGQEKHSYNELMRYIEKLEGEKSTLQAVSEELNSQLEIVTEAHDSVKADALLYAAQLRSLNIDPDNGVHHHYVKGVGAAKPGNPQKFCMVTDYTDYEKTLQRIALKKWDSWKKTKDARVALDRIYLEHPGCPNQPEPVTRHVIHLNETKVAEGRKLAAKFGHAAVAAQPAEGATEEQTGRVQPLRIRLPVPRNAERGELTNKEGDEEESGAGCSKNMYNTRSRSQSRGGVQSSSGTAVAPNTPAKKKTKKSKKARKEESDDPPYDPDIYES